MQISIYTYTSQNRPRLSGDGAGGRRWRVLPQSPNSSDTSMNQMGLRSKFPHKIVNFLYSTLTVNNKLTISWGGKLSKTI